MTEQEWLASDDPRAMLRYITGTEAGSHGNGHRLVSGPHVRGCWALDLLLGKQ